MEREIFNSKAGNAKVLNVTLLDPYRLEQQRVSSEGFCFAHTLLSKFPPIQPKQRNYSSVAKTLFRIHGNPKASSFFGRQGETLRKDLIPRKCSTNFPALCRKTIGLVRLFCLPVALPLPPFSLPFSPQISSSCRVSHLTSIIGTPRQCATREGNGLLSQNPLKKKNNYNEKKIK